MLSTLVLVASASPLLPATHHDGIVSADMPVHPEASQALVAKATNCPAKMEGVLFSHVSKTGGTAAQYLVHKVLGPVGDKEHKVTIFADVGESCQPLSHESASKYFTIGLVRRPCDWMLSTFIQEAGKPYEHLAIPTDESRAAFKAWVNESITVKYPKLGKLSLSNAEKMQEAKMSHVLSAATVTRYGEPKEKLVHCMMHMHTLKADFVRCAKEYQACGGPAGADLSDANLEHILKEAVAEAKGQGRSVGSHATCSSMFDSEMMEQVMGIEKSYIKKYNLGTCC